MDKEEKMYNFLANEVEDLEDDYEEEIQPEDDYNMMLVRKVLFSEPQADLKQRHDLFHTRCKIGKKTCNVIVDSGA
ncbi:unnamed protein product [Amaranthus hypochondriacus]